jgi:hypothetical protein
MEFVLILLMLAAAFYFIIVAPALRSQKSRYTSSRDRNNTAPVTSISVKLNVLKPVPYGELKFLVPSNGV